MRKKFLIVRSFESIGWLIGFVTATLGNYFIIPKLIKRIGQKTTAMGIGLVLGVIIMYIFVTIAQYLVDAYGKQSETIMPGGSATSILTRSKCARSKFRRPTSLIFSLTGSILVIAMLGNYLLEITVAGKNTRMSVTLIAGLILGIIVTLFVVAVILRLLVKTIQQWYERLAPEKRPVFRRYLYLCFVVVPICLIGTVVLWETVVKPRQPVAQVRLEKGEVRKITAREFLKRLHYERERQLASGNTALNRNYVYGLGFAGVVLERMTREIQVRDLAKKRGLTVSEAEIDQLISKAVPKKKILLGAVPPIPRYGLTEDEFREIFRLEVIDSKLREAFYLDIPVKQERVLLKLIRFEFEADARRVIKPDWGNAAFEKLYARVTRGAMANVTEIVRDWSSAEELESDYNPDFSKIVFGLATGECFSQPVSADSGWYLVKALGHEVRAMSEEWRKQRGEDAFYRWLDNQGARVKQFPVWMKRVPPPPGSTEPVMDSKPRPKTIWSW